MNTLGYRSTEDNGLSIELLIDGQPLVELIGLEDTAIPYWLFEGDLPHFRWYYGEDDPSIKGIGVCSCGERGCGCVECRIVREGDVVVFRDFSADLRPKGERKEFRVTSANYDSVIAEIMRQVADYQACTEQVAGWDGE